MRYSVKMARHLVLVCLLAAAPIASAQEGSLGARELYNAGLFDEAVEAAQANWQATASDEAALVLARATLERFTRLESAVELAAARRLLDDIDAAALAPAQAVEWEVGVATGLFFAERAGPAAVMFERLLDHPLLEGAERDRVLNWWATAVDRVGREQQLDHRALTYGRMARRLEIELEQDVTSGAAAYWTVVAARGAGDLERAWNLAGAAWAGAPATVDRAVLRADIDRLVVQGVIPDLATQRTGEPADHGVTVRLMASLAADWEELKRF